MHTLGESKLYFICCLNAKVSCKFTKTGVKGFKFGRIQLKYMNVRIANVFGMEYSLAHAK